MRNTGSQVRDKIILITGAGQGIGRATARYLALKGAKVVLVGRNRIGLDRTAMEIRAERGVCTVMTGDVSSENSVRGFVHETLHIYGRIDVLVNNAGAYSYGPVTTVSIDDYGRVMDTNLKGVFLCSREVIPVMCRQGKGQVINIASQAGIYGFPNMVVYSASKFGVVGFTQALARELEPLNIKVSCICPGYVRTELIKVLPKALLERAEIKEPEQIAHQIFECIEKGKLRPKWNLLVHRILRKAVNG